MTTTMNRREPRALPPLVPIKLLPVTGLRDQDLRITYIPWSDATLGAIGWEVIPDRSHRRLPVLVYVYPVVGGGLFEIRCHVAEEEPNPETDELLGTFQIPPGALGLE